MINSRMHPTKNRLLEISRKMNILLVLLIMSTWIAPLSQLGGTNVGSGDPGMQGVFRQPARLGALTVYLHAANGETILFRAQNGNGLDGNPAQDEMIPHLVLKRNGALTEARERTLEVAVSGLDKLPLDAVLTFKIETQHTDPDKKSVGERRIAVWTSELKVGLNSKKPNSADKLGVTFPETIQDQNGQMIPTPTDYYRLVVEMQSRQMSITQQLVQDYAFVLESQWVAPLVELRDSTHGAAPQELVIYYLDMIPYQVSAFSPDKRVSRPAVDTQIKEVLPGMLNIIRTQTNGWDFPWDKAWTSLRGGRDAERISVALTQAGMWYHGPAPIGANSYISINVNQTELKTYDNLQDWILGIFSHELFHNQQRNINLQAGGNGDVDGSENVWEFITEGTAVLASSVAYARLGYLPFTADGPYLARANEFIAGPSAPDSRQAAELTKISPYTAAIYWRFLYEYFGRLQDGKVSSAKGMEVIRRTLITLYSDPFFFQAGPNEVADRFPKLMDTVLSSDPESPFKNYRESWNAFAQAIYRLSLDHKDTRRSGKYAFFDPYQRYAPPPTEEIKLVSGTNVLAGSLSGSLGMNFINIRPGAKQQGQAIVLHFANLNSQPVAFHLQVWAGSIEEDEGRTQSGFRDLGDVEPGEEHEYVLDSKNDQWDGFYGLIVTQVSTQDAAEPAAYQITLEIEPPSHTAQVSRDDPAR